MSPKFLFVNPCPFRRICGLPISTSYLRNFSCSRSQTLRRTLTTATNTVNNLNDLQKSDKKIWLPNESYTYQLGKLLAKDSRPGDVLFLKGDLGAGKTSVARGYIHAARRDPTLEVTSPTYLLANTYPPLVDQDALVPVIYHMDLWRLDDASERPIVDFDFVFSKAVSLVEWPDRLKRLTPPTRLDVIIEYPSTPAQPPVQDESDPWGFGDGEGGMDSPSKGRFVSFVPHGSTWLERLDAFQKLYMIPDDDNGFVLTL